MRVGYRLRELLALVSSVSHLGAGRPAQAKIAALGLLLPLKKRFRATHETLVRLQLQVLGSQVPFTVKDRADFEILREIISDESYALSGPLQPRTIVDLGSNVGSSVLYFHLRYPEARIVGVEPSPVSFRQLQRNVGSLPGVEILPRAVAGRDGSMPFHVSPHGLASSLSPLEGDFEVTTVQVNSLDRLLQELSIDGLDVLKIDIEGAEWEVLSSFRGLDRVQTVIGELHMDMIEQSWEEFFRLLEGFEVHTERIDLPDIPGADRWRFEATRPGPVSPAGR